MNMPFGKHKGKPIESIPEQYLCWLLDNIDDLSPTLRQAIQKRLKIEDPPQAAMITSDIIASWFRTLAKEFHPDKRGGNHEAMKAINRARELMLAMTH